MTQNKIKQLHQWYGWVLAAVLAALGVLFILSCLDIYTSGPRPYSAEAIALRFQRIAIPVFIAIAGVIGGIALNLLLPLEQRRSKGISTPKDLMLRLQRKVDIPPVQKEVRLRKALRAGTALCFTALMIYPLVYFLTPGHFSVSELNADIIQAVLIALLPALTGLTLCWVCRSMVNSSFRREAAIYKQALAEGHRTSILPTVDQSPKCNCGLIRTIQISMIVLACIFIILGIFNGGAEDVLKKAIAICTECIGLG